MAFSTALRSSASRTIASSSQIPMQRTSALIKLRHTRHYAEGEGKAGSKEHVTDKPTTDGKYNVQSSASKAGQEERAKGSEQSQATSQKDVRNNNERAEKEHPEAPRPVIGMNEERGTKGY
ncbi:MAG: hypothetical protein M1828_003543 [Chrysothrix sp. TS-e1954]|nr:MAG: hypothetical protein M1828_003543 [Chrysothrix sp. TS-e1954]